MRKRAAASGFTLIELMVVVVIVSVLAVLAMPAMSRSRDDRMAFDFARRIEQLANRARTRAAARGAAQLFVASPDGGGRGQFLLFEALDGSPVASGGPNPVSTCKNPGEWNDVLTWSPGVVSNNARLIDGVNMNATTGVIVNANLRASFFVTNAVTGAIVICVNPAGTTWVGSGSSVSAAITGMQAAVLPFNSSLEMRVLRGGSGTTGDGLARRVLVAGSAAARIKSE